MKTAATLLVSIGLLLSMTASADSSGRCDCSRTVSSCGGRVTLDGSTLVIQSSKPQCSLVTWYADDQQRSTIVVGGRVVEQWTGPTANPQLSVATCRVCIDTGQEVVCRFPDTSRLNMPDGASATGDQMLAAHTEVKNFQAAADGYLQCLERKFSVIETPEAKAEHYRLHYVAIDRMESVAGRFNAELKAFRSRSE